MEYTKKVIVIGDMGVGKTSFVARVTEGRYLNEHKMTIGGLPGELRALNLTSFAACL